MMGSLQFGMVDTRESQRSISVRINRVHGAYDRVISYFISPAAVQYNTHARDYNRHNTQNSNK